MTCLGGGAAVGDSPRLSLTCRVRGGRSGDRPSFLCPEELHNHLDVLRSGAKQSECKCVTVTSQSPFDSGQASVCRT